jgi:hypothetical protein
MNAEAARYSWLPQVLAEIAEVAGLDAALKLAEKRGGTEVYIPLSAADDHWLVELVGRDAADAICAYFQHGVKVTLPAGPRGSLAKIRATAERMIAERRPTSEIALACGYTLRGVWKRKARLRERDDRRQGKLL